MSEICACGRELHYNDPAKQKMVETLIKEVGSSNVLITTNNKTYSVPRHYIALHGLKASELPILATQYNFREILPMTKKHSTKSKRSKPINKRWTP